MCQGSDQAVQNPLFSSLWTVFEDISSQASSEEYSKFCLPRQQVNRSDACCWLHHIFSEETCITPQLADQLCIGKVIIHWPSCQMDYSLKTQVSSREQAFLAVGRRPPQSIMEFVFYLCSFVTSLVLYELIPKLKQLWSLMNVCVFSENGYIFVILSQNFFSFLLAVDFFRLNQGNF